MAEIVEIIKKAQRKSIMIVGKLFVSLNLNPKDYMIIFKNIKFGYTDNNEQAYFSAPADEIIINDEYINIIKRSLDKVKDKEKLKKTIIDDLALTLAHETIHACRVINSKDKVSEPFIMQMEIDKMCKEEVNLNETFKTVACYEIHNITREEYISNRNDEYLRQIEKQESLEECLTEALAQIGYLSMKENKPIDEIIQDIINQPNMRPDAVIGAKILNLLSKDVLKWFLTTSFNDEYIDILNETFLDDYPKLLHIVNSVYRSYIDSDFKK